MESMSATTPNASTRGSLSYKRLRHSLTSQESVFLKQNSIGNAAGLLQRQGHVREAESCFVRALTRTRQQQAKGAELRVAMLLSHLWQEQGEGEKARQLLMLIYHSFTEGFETTELQEAKALLDELAC